MNPTRQLLLTRLADERGKQVVFVSHCLLNENTRYLGGAFRRSGVGLDEIIAGFQHAGIGLWSHGRQRQYITYKAKAAGIAVTLVEEASTSHTCPCTLLDGTGCLATVS